MFFFFHISEMANFICIQIYIYPGSTLWCHNFTYYIMGISLDEYRARIGCYNNRSCRVKITVCVKLFLWIIHCFDFILIEFYSDHSFAVKLRYSCTSRSLPYRWITQFWYHMYWYKCQFFLWERESLCITNAPEYSKFKTKNRYYQRQLN